MRPLIIALDPGHGGSNYGTPAGLPDFVEPEMTLEVARLCCTALAFDDRFRPVLLRIDDDDLDLVDRNEIAKKAEADLIVSVHFNASDDPNRSGMECYHWRGNHKARRLCERLLIAAPQALKPGRVWNHIEAQAPGATAVLAAYDAPTVLVECAFLSNPGDREWLSRHESLDQIARGVVAAMPHALNIFGDADV